MATDGLEAGGLLKAGVTADLQRRQESGGGGRDLAKPRGRSKRCVLHKDRRGEVSVTSHTEAGGGERHEQALN